jgi:asparagine synthase (glutamine-hydrolysing)
MFAMCGIAGYVGSRELERRSIEHCLELMHHRGPDHAAATTWTNPAGRHVHMLSTRLQIIDLDPRAHMPFSIGSKRLVQNGELYNYLEVRRDLERAGRSFRTESDTEVLTATIDEWGLAGLDRCEGMWAFSVYDEADGSLALCRDRFGEKPLYIYREDDAVYFGSEAKFIVALLGRELQPNLDHLYRYLVNGYKALYKQPTSFFHGLEELPPGMWLEIDASGGESRRAYWQLVAAVEGDLSYDEAVAGVRERLLRAVELRLRADVPLAFCMSGGVDSVSLISIAKKIFDYDVHGFTIINTDERYEEQELVDHSVAELGIRHTAIPVDTGDFLAKLRGLVRAHDSPRFTITYIAHWLLMEAIGANGYRISISGTAADELFTGYYDHHLAYLYEVHGNPALHGPAKAAWHEHVRPLVRNPHLQDPELFVHDAGFREHMYLNADDFASYLHEPWAEPFREERYSDRLLRNRMLNELFNEAVPVILHEDDLNAMYFSIENRSPFLDRPLFEFSRSIPTELLVRDGYAKAVLRDAMRGIAPARVLDSRRKVGFNAPILSFLDVEDANVRGYLLDDSPVYEHVRRNRIEQLLAKDYLPNSESKFLFNFLNAKIFLEEFSG